MAVFTDVGRQDMRRVLAGCIGTVVTADAVVRDVHVVEVRGKPCDGRMTVVAVVTAGDMRRVLAFRGDTVVA